jgi:hypothetical protein
MKRTTLNFIVDLISFIVFVGLAITGFIIKFILPPGTGGRGRLLHEGRGREEIKNLLSMSRHEWGNIHFYLAIAFFILIIVHIILHWAWIKRYFKSMFTTSYVNQNDETCTQ